MREKTVFWLRIFCNHNQHHMYHPFLSICVVNVATIVMQCKVVAELIFKYILYFFICKKEFLLYIVSFSRRQICVLQWHLYILYTYRYYILTDYTFGFIVNESLLNFKDLYWIHCVSWTFDYINNWLYPGFLGYLLIIILTPPLPVVRLSVMKWWNRIIITIDYMSQHNNTCLFQF